MTTAQGWALIGGLLAAVGIIAGLVVQAIRVSIEGLRNEMVARFDSLERDLQRIYVRVFHTGGEEPG